MVSPKPPAAVSGNVTRCGGKIATIARITQPAMTSAATFTGDEERDPAGR
jgi:hypothetical protein